MIKMRGNRRERGKNEGFSLIELIIAVAILAVLTGLLAPQFIKYVEKSREVRDIQAMDTVYSAVQVVLTSEDVYEELLSGTETETFKDSLENVLERDDAFGYEMKSLLGETKGELKSRKATDAGRICVEIEYREGKSDSEKGISEPGGFGITVYCGDSAANPVGELEAIGSNLAEEGR